MKKLLFYACLVASCQQPVSNSRRNPLQNPPVVAQVPADSIPINSAEPGPVLIYPDGRMQQITFNCDSLKTELLLAQYKLNRVSFYLNICLKKPSQDKFLKGWIRRAIH
jgi:hypothetical protein